MQILETVIRSTPIGATAGRIEGHREVRYDPIAKVRHGQCVIHTDSEDILVPFIVEWQDAEKGVFQVRVPESIY